MIFEVESQIFDTCAIIIRINGVCSESRENGARYFFSLFVRDGRFCRMVK